MRQNQDDLIYDLIFSKKEKFNIDISDYISDIYEYEKFIDEIKKILKRSKVKIIISETSMNSKTVIWELKVKK